MRRQRGVRRRAPEAAGASRHRREGRALRLELELGRALERAGDERGLCAEVCRLLVEAGGALAARVGLVEARPGRALRWVAWAGPAPASAGDLVPWAGVTEPAASALRSGALRVSGRTAAMPLPPEVGGVLEVTSDAGGAPGAEALPAVARDLALGLRALRRRAEGDRASDRHRAATRQLEAVLEAVPDFIARFDRRGRTRYLNAAVERLMGQPPGGLLGQTVPEVRACVDPAEDLALHHSVLRVAASGVAERLEVRFRSRPEPRLHEVRHLPERDRRGRVTGVLGIATDLTGRRQAERQVEMLSHALDQVAEGLFLFEGDSPLIRYVNRGGAAALGYTQEELTGGMSVLEIDPSLDEASWKELLTEPRHLAGLRLESTHRTRDGRVFPIEVTGRPFVFRGRRFSLAITRDISQRRADQEALASREAAYRTLAENLPDLVMRWDPALRRTYVNPAFAAAMGAPPEALLGASLGEGYAGDLAARNADAIAELHRMVREVLATGQPLARELLWYRAEGVRTTLSQVVPERDEAGRVTSALGIARDITSLKESEQQLRTLAENSPDVIVRLDREGRYLYLSRAAEGLLGRSLPEYRGLPFGALLGDADQPPFRELRGRIPRLLASGERLELDVALPGPGGERAFSLRMLPEGGGAETALVVMRDVTEARRSEAALRASEQRFRLVTGAIDEVFALVDMVTRKVLYVSPAVHQVYGTTPEALQANAWAWLDVVHAEDRDRVRAELATLLEGPRELEYRVVGPGGVRWLRTRTWPVERAEGEAERVASVTEDVTARRQLEDQLRQAQKLEAVGRLAGGIAHDFNNLLLVMELHAGLALEVPDLPAEVREGLEQLLAATGRATTLTRQLLTFSRNHRLQRAPVELGTAVAGMARLVQRVLGAEVVLEVRAPPGLPPIPADVGMVEQVVLNLAVNARDAMPGGGRLTVTVEAVEVPAAQATAHPGAAPGRHLCLQVSDTGTGIQPEVLPRVFEPFFTTKEPGKGTGLGLATVAGIAEQHRGWVEVDSRPGTGSTFRVYFPVLGAEGEGPPEAPEAPVAPPALRSATVLLVEDEDAVRRVTRLGLERSGYRVLEADRATGAEALWREHGPRVDLLLTDLVMPGGTSGLQLAERLRAERPDLKVLLTTGYSPTREPEAMEVLLKPYTVRELLGRVEAVLAGRAP